MNKMNLKALLLALMVGLGISNAFAQEPEVMDDESTYSESSEMADEAPMPADDESTEYSSEEEF